MTQPYGNLKIAKVLVIGHEPRLQNSESIPEYSFYADYFFSEEPKSGPEKRKYGLAKSLYEYLDWLTSGKYKPEQFYITNLTNRALDRKEDGKTVLINTDYAQEGVFLIRDLAHNNNFDLIFAMSLQPNYWLQLFGACNYDEEFMRMAEPKDLNSDYQPKEKECFKKICGKQFDANGIPLFPILHVKQYSLKGPAFKSYLPDLENCRKLVSKI